MNGEECAIVQFPSGANWDFFEYEIPITAYLPPGINYSCMSATPDWVKIDHPLIKEFNHDEAEMAMFAAMQNLRVT